MRCGNNPNTPLTDGDRAWVDWFQLYLRWSAQPEATRGPPPATPDGSDPITGRPPAEVGALEDDDQGDDQLPVAAYAGRYRWYDTGAGVAAGGELVDRDGVGPFDDGTIIAQGITLDAACQRVTPYWVRAIPRQLGRPLPPTR